jgi:hypothetical protein
MNVAGSGVNFSRQNFYEAQIKKQMITEDKLRIKQVRLGIKEMKKSDGLL